MSKKSIMIDMDEVIVVGNFSNYLIEFLGEVDFEKLHSQYRQDLIKGREEEYINIKTYIKIIIKIMLKHYLIVWK